MKIKCYYADVESFDVVSFVRILGKYGVRFEMSDEWSFVDHIEPDKKNWFRTFKVYATKRMWSIICNEVNRMK